MKISVDKNKMDSVTSNIISLNSLISVTQQAIEDVDVINTLSLVNTQLKAAVNVLCDLMDEGK